MEDLIVGTNYPVAFYESELRREIQDALLREKYVESMHSVDMLATAVEANKERTWLEHELNIRESVGFLDTIYEVYAGAYKPDNNGGLELISQRTVHSSAFDPMVYDEFTKAIYETESGTMAAWFGVGTQYERLYYLYYKWMPLYSPPDQRYLVVAGVSVYSVESAIPIWVSAGQWVSTIITFGLNTWLIILLVRLGSDE